MKKDKRQRRLELWKDRYRRAEEEYAQALAGIKSWWRQYQGDRSINDKGAPATLIRNFTYELIETQVDNSIPQPKVTSPDSNPRKKHNARVIEEMLRGFINTAPFEAMNDEEERIVKAIGGAFRLIGWDSSDSTRRAAGKPYVRTLYPNQVIPQAGVYDLASMDYVFVVFSDTKDRLNKRYGVHIDQSEQSERTIAEDERARDANPEEVILQISAYYINDNGSLGVFSWAGNTVLEDMEECRARTDKVCKKCGRSLYGDSRICVCGSRDFKMTAVDKEEIFEPIVRSDGSVISPYAPDPEDPRPDKLRRVFLPYYTPKIFPIMLRKNVSCYGKFLGDSDCEKIRDLQTAHNMLATRLQEKMMKGGSILTLPKGIRIETSDRESKIVYLENAAQKNLIDAVSLQPGIAQDLEMLNKYYEDARSTLGITDSYQGKDSTRVISGTAKQIEINRAEGRLESKRKMKQASYEELFRALFQYMLAYADEPRTVGVVRLGEDAGEELVFNRYDFLEQDENGDWYYDDDYVFEVDTSASNDRQSMWSQIRANFEAGVYGDRSDIETLKLYWNQLKAQDYPNAANVLTQLEQRTEESL